MPSLTLQLQEGLAPDIVTFNVLMKAAGAAGLMGEVLRLYQGLQASPCPAFAMDGTLACAVVMR